MTALRQRWSELEARVQGTIALVGIVVTYFLLYKVVPGTDTYITRRAPHEPIVVGIIYGTVNALLAIGLILIYRTNRFLNFSYAAMGSLFGFTAITLHVERDVPYFLLLPLAVIGGVILGAVLEVAVIRRFKDSSRLIATVASIGLAQLLGGIEFIIINNILKEPLFQGGFRVPISFDIDIGNKTLIGDEILIVMVVPFIIAGLAWFLLRTDAGVAVRAAAENADRALLLGIPIRRLSTIVWALAGGLATLTFMLKAPFAGAAPSAGQGITILLPAFAAAVVARMESLPIAFAAGIGLGVMESIVRHNSSGSPTFNNVVFFVVILVALLAQRGKLSRAMLGDQGFSFASVVKPTPPELRQLPEVRWAKVALVALSVALLVFVPQTFGRSSQLLAVFAVAAAITGVSLVVLTGWGGHISLGQFAFLGIGAVVAGNLIEARVDLMLALVAAGAAGGIAALVVGLPALRIRGLFLAVTTLAFAVALDSWFLNPTERGSLMPTIERNPFLFERFDLESNYALYLLSLAVLGLAVLAAIGVRKTRAGRVVIATRDNQRAADAAAVPTTRVKLTAFLLSGTIAGVAGGLHILALGSLGQSSYPPEDSLDVFTTAVIGGLGTLTGAVSGVLLFKFLETWQWLAEYRLVVTGVGLLVVLYAVPGGIGQVLFTVRDRYLRWVAVRRDILVPSLVADKRVEGKAEHAADEVGLLASALSSPTGDGGEGARPGSEAQPEPEPVGAKQ
ncbi:MAG: ABC transporter permease [Actinomycetota bacterium]